jgi:hypothetical protein
MEPTEFFRDCSSCGKQLFYKRKLTLEKATTNNSVCPSCRTAQNNKSFKRNSKTVNNPSWKGFKDIPGKVFSKLKRDAATRNIGFFITLQDISDVFEQQNRLCALSGNPISFLESTASVDRIDSSKDYTTDNIQIVHKHINMMKRDFNNDYFIQVCKYIANNNR